MSTHAADGDAHEPPRSDLKDAIGWMALGIAVLVASLRMDRLESQGVNPYTVPGLLPGLLGLAMIVLGSVLALRSWRRGALTEALASPGPQQREEHKRIAVVISLVLGYGLVLVGHSSLLVHLLAPGSLLGLPYWLASTIFVTTSILVLHRLSPDPADRRFTPGAVLKALVIGLAASLAVQIVFQELFLVRLP
ncbi:tripartite tricarboxylate transporter TctB family protein [Ramlibacter sp.]|uniref:tripartite tricarboxylate transporter TctB family protein n=1 Tax=Ramlibacter sp. TaxID=1917967 RepID=UPI00260DDB6F|nr:tripartite tricarboxylate transporter TctB family protein [Ramlibacter sp.]MDB5957813.1 hypothetical protein [Ramlibacter sp.]